MDAPWARLLAEDIPPDAERLARLRIAPAPEHVARCVRVHGCSSTIGRSVSGAWRGSADESDDALRSFMVGVAASVSHDAQRRGPLDGWAALSGVWPMQLSTPSGWKTFGSGRNERN